MLQVFWQIENGMLSLGLELGNVLPQITAHLRLDILNIIEWLYSLFGELIFQLFLFM